MAKETIDEPTFRRLCEDSWSWAESEGEMGHPVNRYSREVPFLFGLKNALCKYFGIQDEVEGVYCQEGEIHSEAYVRKIGEILAGKLNPHFDHTFWSTDPYSSRTRNTKMTILLYQGDLADEGAGYSYQCLAKSIYERIRDEGKRHLPLPLSLPRMRHSELNRWQN